MEFWQRCRMFNCRDNCGEVHAALTEDILTCMAYEAEMSREQFVDIPLECPA